MPITERQREQRLKTAGSFERINEMGSQTIQETCDELQGEINRLEAVIEAAREELIAYMSLVVAQGSVVRDISESDVWLKKRSLSEAKAACPTMWEGVPVSEREPFLTFESCGDTAVCGCAAYVTEHANAKATVTVHLCPMHAAAEKMLKALELVDRDSRLDDSVSLRDETSDAVDAALAAAKGEG